MSPQYSYVFAGIRWAVTFLMFLLVTEPWCGAQEQPLRFEFPRHLTGSIFADTNRTRLLFRFERTCSRTNSTLHVTRDFSTPHGDLVAREEVVYEGNVLASFKLEDFQSGTRGAVATRSVSSNSSKIQLDLSYTKPGGREEHAGCTEATAEATLVNDMIAPFFLSHWDELQRGAKVKCRLIVLSRKETVGFTFSLESESSWQGNPMVIIKMAPTSPVIATMVEPIYFFVQKAAPHLVFEYVGRTTPKVLAKNKWKDLDAVTVFDWP